jgi:hypothetical protein
VGKGGLEVRSGELASLLGGVARRQGREYRDRARDLLGTHIWYEGAVILSTFFFDRSISYEVPLKLKVTVSSASPP